MRLSRRRFVSLGALPIAASAASAQDYELGPDSQPQPGVPQGHITTFKWVSRIFPGTQRDVWVYVPKQVDAAKPACVMVFQDGGGFVDRNGGMRAPVVMDNLIAKGEMPVTVGVFLNPGVVPAANPNALPRFNRSHEYDALSDAYARFLLEEILPEAAQRAGVMLTKNPNERALCGSSSGGIASFTVAWERPDAFRRVISFIGSYTNLQGGHTYPSLIRKHEPKPLRIYLQDGRNDQDIYSGNWWIGNQDVYAALKFAGYDTMLTVGEGGHDGRQAGAVLPDAMRWVWRDYPKPIATPINTRQPVMEVVAPGEEWEEVTAGMTGAVRLTALCGGPNGELRLYDAAGRRILVLQDAVAGRMAEFLPKVESVSGMAMGSDATLYACQPAKKRLMAYAVNKEKPVGGKIAAQDVVCANDGTLFAYEPEKGEVWRIPREGKAAAIVVGYPNGAHLALTPDQSLLMLSLPGGRSVVSMQLASGGVAHAQPFFDVHIPPAQDNPRAGGMAFDTEGRLYLASAAGIQIFDQAGRVIGILENPAYTPTTALAFGGPGRNILLALSVDGKLYRRKTHAKGVFAFEAPIKPPPPRL